MSGALDVDLAEFGALRDEIGSRTQITTTIIVAELAAVGTGLPLVGAVPDAALGVAAASSLLWLLWLDHAASVHKIAAYLAIALRRRLRAAAGSDVLGWEAFYRRVDRGGDEAHAALGLAGTTVARLGETRPVGRYIHVLFGGTSIAALVVYALHVIAHHKGFSTIGWVGRAVAIVLVFVLAAYAFLMSRSYDELVRTINAAIAHDATEEEETRASSSA
jgi:hypothetical protein